MGAPPDPRQELAAIAREVRRHALWARSLGEVEAPLAAPEATLLPAATPASHAHPPETAAAPPPTGRPAASPARPAPQPLPTARVAPAPARGADALQALRAEIGDCRRCRLCESRTNLVFGVGNPRAEIVFVGEGPGADEDRQGEPFVGKAGQLLTRMIEAMGYRRDEVYICNVVKCRPPGNRSPQPDEIAACEPFLQRQIEAVGPKAIIALGKFAAQTLLRTQAPITRLRGQWHEVWGVPLMPTFHPAYLLRSPQEKGRAWADLQAVLARLGRQPPRR